MDVINNHQKLCDVASCFLQLGNVILYELNASDASDYICLLLSYFTVLVEILSSNFGWFKCCFFKDKVHTVSAEQPCEW